MYIQCVAFKELTIRGECLSSHQSNPSTSSRHYTDVVFNRKDVLHMQVASGSHFGDKRLREGRSICEKDPQIGKDSVGNRQEMCDVIM